MNLVKCDGCGIIEAARERYSPTPINWAKIRIPTTHKDEDGDEMDRVGHICPECMKKVTDLLGLRLRFDG